MTAANLCREAVYIIKHLTSNITEVDNFAAETYRHQVVYFCIRVYRILVNRFTKK